MSSTTRRQVMTAATLGAAAAASVSNAQTAKSGLPPRPEMVGADQQQMLSALQSAKGAELDRTYVVQQVDAHTAALVTQQAYAAQGANPNLRQTTQSAVPLIQHHLEMARQLNAPVGESN